jgi:hypothetical protein
MSSQVVDDFATAWTPDASGLWSTRADASCARFGADGLGMEIVAAAGSPADPPPFAERRLPAAVDLRERDELRLWLRSSRPGDGTAARPHSLLLEADSDPASAAPWRRLIGVSVTDRWELQRLSLADMPQAVRQRVRMLRLRSLDPTTAFTGAVDDLLAVRPRALADLDDALLARLDGTITVPGAAGDVAVPAVLDVPEAPGTRTAPYLLVTTTALVPLGRRGAADALPGDRTPTGGGIRPAPVVLRVDLRIDAVVEDRIQKAALLDALVADLERPLVVAGVPYLLEPFEGNAEPGRAPLFVRLVLPQETGAPTFSELAHELLSVGHIDDRPGAEALPA